MKLKYKKIILLTTMSTMGIGLLTLSVSHDKTDAKESLNPQPTIVASADEDTAVEETFAADAQSSPVPTSELTDAPTASPTPIPSPTPLPINKIEKKGTYPEVDKLIEEYYAAKNTRDVETMKELLSDPSGALSQEELQTKTEYIDEYRNIKTYTKKGFKDGTYIVYAYSEIKFTSINTPAPGLAKFYIITGDDGKPKIFSGEMDAETQAYYAARNEDKDVIALIEMTDKNGEEACKKDEDLKNFWDSIKNMANSSTDNTATPGN